MAALQPARGTHDLIGEEQRRFDHIVSTARRLAELYGFDEWQTPIFEDTRVFSRTLGETSDVVTKEMYSFDDRGGESLTLRPENTAGICRALVTNGLTQSLPQRVFYAGPMFRYERPQKGRYRQFHQVGAELIGSAEPLADAETIALGRDLLAALGVAEGVVLEINTLGDKASREAYRAALIAYLSDHRASLSKESAARLERNPLRVLDSKDPADQRLVADAPTILPHLTADAARFYDDLRRHLDTFGVAYRENPRIVRGLDYYNHTAFEFVTGKLGAQGTVLGGGRYDGLIAEMGGPPPPAGGGGGGGAGGGVGGGGRYEGFIAVLGGPPTPAVGWAAGVERLSMLLEDLPAAVASVAVVPVDEAAEGDALGVLQRLRASGVRAEIGHRGNLKKRLERANRAGARAAVLVGADGGLQVKTLATGVQEPVASDGLVAYLSR